MTEKQVIAISDCDHADMCEERRICDQYGLDMVHLSCKTEDDLIEQLQGYSAVVNQYAPFTERVFSSLPDLKMIVRYGVGVNNIDLKAATKHGVAVCNVPDYGVQEVASHAFSLMLSLTRKIPRMDRSVKSGQWEYSACMPVRRFSNMTVGIVGLGRIGRCFAGMVHSLNCRIIGTDINVSKEVPDYVEIVSFETLLSECDVISVHSNLETSYHLFGADELQKMKQGSYLINVSRGGIIDENALAASLNAEHLGGAGLDVSEIEPLPEDSPLRSAKNILLTPHMAWYSEEASSDLKTKAAQEAARYLTHQPLKNQVNL